MVPCSVTVGLGRLFAATVFTVPGHWRATGALVAALPAVLRVVAHDSRPVSFPRMSHGACSIVCVSVFLFERIDA